MADNSYFDQFKTADSNESNESKSTKKDESYFKQFLNAQLQDELPTKDTVSSVASAIYQPIAGAYEFTPPGLLTTLWELLARGESLSELEELSDPYRQEQLRRIAPESERHKIGVDREKFLENIEIAAGGIPTLSNLEESLKEHTGVDLSAKTPLEKALRLAGSAGKIHPGGLTGKAVAAGIAPAVSTTAQAAGIPEPFADILGLGASGIAPGREAVKKSSGLPSRRFEDLKKEKKVTPKTFERITGNLEKDVRDLSNKLIESESEVATKLKKDPEFYQKLEKDFDRVSDLAKQIDESVSSKSIRDDVKEKMISKSTKGISPDEYERAYKIEMNKLHRQIPEDKVVSVSDLVDQFRKNNKSARELYEPGKSGAKNRAKRDGVYDYNQVIQENFEKNHPDSKFNELFKSTNETFSQAKNVEKIEDFFDKTFGEKINYKQARKFFNEPSTERAFKRILGEDAYSDMKQIMNDFISTEESMKLLKKAEAMGLKETAKIGLSYMIHPKMAAASTVKRGVDFLRDVILPNEKYRTIWKHSANNFKKGNFKEAEKGFKELEKLRPLADRKDKN